MQKYREKLADQQEIVGALADIVIEIYAMESALAARAEDRSRSRRWPPPRPCAQPPACCSKTAPSASRPAPATALAASVEGDMLRTQLAVLRRFLKREPVDTIALRRAVATAVETAGRYPFDGR